jgi:hypothetical protein
MSYENYENSYQKRTDNFKVGKRTDFWKDYHPPKLTEDNILQRIKELSSKIDAAYSSPYLNEQKLPSAEIIKLLNYTHDLIVKLRDNYNALAALNQDTKSVDEDQIIIAVGDEEVVIDGNLAASVIQYAVQAYVTEALTDAVEIDQEISEGKND